jgi:hypothetical protein
VFDPEEDLHGDNADCWTGTRAVTLRVARRDRDVDYRVEGVRRHVVQASEAENSGGAVVARDCVFNVPAAKLLSGVNDPEIGYVLFDEDDADKQWTILRTDLASAASRWRLTCRNLAITDGLADTIEIWSPTNRKDVAGGNVGAFLPRHMGVQAKVFEVRGDDADQHGRSGTVLEYRVVVGRRLYVDSNDQVRWVKPGEPPTVLEVLSHEGAERLGELQTIVCRRGMW